MLDSIDRELEKYVMSDKAHQFGMAVASKMRKSSAYQFTVAGKDIELVLFNTQNGRYAPPFFLHVMHTPQPTVQIFHPMTSSTAPITYTPFPITYTPFAAPQTAPPLTSHFTTYL